MKPKTKSQLEAELQEAREQIARLERALKEVESIPGQKSFDGSAQLEEKFRWLLENLPVGISILNAENRVIFSNHVLQDILQISEDGLASGSYRSRRYLAADGSPMPANGFASVQAINSGQPVYNVTTGIVKEEGETIWLNISAMPVTFTDWNTVIVSSDITQLKRAEDALKQSEAKYAALFEKGSVPAALSKMPEVTFADVNEAFQAAFGYSREEILGKTSLEIGMARPEEHAQTYASIERYGTTHDNEKHLFTKSGELRIGLINASRVEINGQDFVITTIHDVTGRKLAEQKLIESESRFATIFENSPVAMGISNLNDGKITEANAAFLNLYGYGREEVIGHTTAELGIWATTADRQRFIDQLQTEGNVRNLELVARLKSGGERHVLVSGERVEINGRPCLLAQIQDITGRKSLEESLRESQEKYNLLFEKSTVPTVLLKLPEVVIVDVNEACEKLTGFRREEMFGKTAVELGLGGKEERTELVSRFERQGALTGNETRLVTRAGEERVVITNTMPVSMGGQRYAITTMQDITARKRAEQELVQQSEMLRERTELLEYAHVLIRDLENRIVLWNRGMERLYGWTREEATGQVTHTFLQTEFPLSLEAYQEELMQNGHWEGELTHVRKYGTRITVASHHTLYRDPAGMPHLILEVNNDITGRRRAEQELERSQENFARAFHSNPAALAITRVEDGKFILINEAYTRFMGYEPDEIIGRRTTDLEIYVNPLERQELVRQVREQGQVRSHELLVRSKSGEVHSLLLSMEPIQYSDEACLLSTFLDITERKRMEDDLRASRRLLQDVIDNTSALVYILDTDGRFLLINRRLEALFGLGTAEVVGRSRTDFLTAEAARQHRENDLEIIRSGKGQTFEEENLEPDGRHVYVTTKFPLFDLAGGVYAVCGISTDITVRKQMEEELRRSNAELEQFAYIASHDLQEPLRAVTGMVQLLQRRYQGKLDEQADVYINHAVDAAGRMQALIQALLTYSRVDRRSQPMGPVQANDCLRAALRNLDVAIRESQAVITADDLPEVTADPTQLVQLFQNLVGNAIKFRGDRQPHVQISVSRLKDAWQFAVHDNGIGIEPQYFERIFQIFQRLHTRREYSGTGIGLALCRKIVERHGGSIWVEATPGEGSTFFFTLPARSIPYEQHHAQTR